jgi:hypothetical protein
MKAFAARLLVVLLVGAVSACGPEKKKDIDMTDPRDKFVGEWKSADTNAETHTYIKRSNNSFFIHEGQQDIVGTYDEVNKTIIIDNGTKKVPVIYLPETDQIRVTGGSRDAKFSRVKK